MPNMRIKFFRILSAIFILSIVFLGCDYGLMVDILREKEIDAIGVELSDSGIRHTKPEVREYIHNLDVTKHMPFGKYDLVISIEVAEHLMEEDADDFVKNIKKHSLDQLLFSAAEPGSEGTGHFNCQPFGYWIKKLEQHGLKYDKNKTHKLRNLELPTCPWLNSTLGYFNLIE